MRAVVERSVSAAKVDCLRMLIQHFRCVSAVQCLSLQVEAAVKQGAPPLEDFRLDGSDPLFASLADEHFLEVPGCPVEMLCC